MSENLEEKILQLSRNGLQEELSSTIEACADINVNCQGKSKSNKTWTPLHLAAYFGHLSCVEVLLNNNADPDRTNQTGDTPLHKAALTSRENVVMCLLQHDASSLIRNDETKRASQVACDRRIRNVLEAAEKGECLKLREAYIQAVKEGKADVVKDMISRNAVNVNVCDDLGNTALHHSAMRDQRAMVAVLLQHGADPSKTNNNGHRAVDLCESQQMKRLLDVRPLRSNFKCAKRFEGPLMKGKRFLGPRWYWVVLDRGVISFFQRRADASLWMKRKVFKYLTEATATVREDNQVGFSIKYFDGSRHDLMVNQKNNPLVHRQKWLDAIIEHTRYSNHFVVGEHAIVETDDYDDNSEAASLIDVKNSVQTAQAHHQVLKADIEELTSLVQQYVTDHPLSSDCQSMSAMVLGKCHKVLSTSSEMSQRFAECLAVLEQHNQGREAQLNEEKEKNRVLEQALQALAAEHHDLERSITLRSSPTMPVQPGVGRSSIRRSSTGSRAASSGDYRSEEDDEFYDAVSGDSDDNASEMSSVEAGYDDNTRAEGDSPFVTSPSTSSQLSQMSISSNVESSSNEKPCDSRRTQLPVPMFSREEFSIWHILRQCIGKELSKITMPVIFNEPLSFIQRLCEYMEYCSLLEKACSEDDSLKRMEYVSAFAVSALASQMDRLGKPFNPLLGETYENRRDDLGFHWVSEQVSHHPPVSAFHAAGTDDSKFPFVFHGSVYPKLKFWGKSVEVEPKGTIVLELTKRGETYTWSNPKISIHNIVVGKLWMEQHGTMEIVNHTRNERCLVTFKSYSWFRNDINKIEGTVFNSDNEPVRHLVGDWTKYVYSMSPASHQEFMLRTAATDTSSNKRKSRSKSQTSMNDADDVIDTLTSLSAQPGCECLWKVQARPELSAKMYNMTSFAMTLNEEGDKGLPPTDSRLRPDIRCLENGDIDSASERKHYLEEKQRSARKLRHKKKIDWNPRWFAKQSVSYSSSSQWYFNDQYFRQDWTNCPDIF